MRASRAEKTRNADLRSCLLSRALISVLCWWSSQIGRRERRLVKYGKEGEERRKEETGHLTERSSFRSRFNDPQTQPAPPVPRPRPRHRRLSHRLPQPSFSGNFISLPAAIYALMLSVCSQTQGFVKQKAGSFFSLNTDTKLIISQPLASLFAFLFLLFSLNERVSRLPCVRM